MANARPKTLINVKHRYNGTLGVDAVMTDFFLKLQLAREAKSSMPLTKSHLDGIIKK